MTPSDMLYEPDPSPGQMPAPHLTGTIYIVVLGIIGINVHPDNRYMSERGW